MWDKNGTPDRVTRANAELICRAVNAHADLVAALQSLAETSWTDTDDGEDSLKTYRAFVKRTAEAALAKAGAS